MNPVHFNKKSWHYWIAVHIGDYDPRLRPDICSYVKAVISGMTQFLFMMVSLATLAVTMIYSIVWHCIHGWTIEGSQFVQVGSIICGLAVLLAGAIGVGLGVISLRVYLQRRRLIKPAKTKNASFLTTAYHSLKEKVCYPVSFDE